MNYDVHCPKPHRQFLYLELTFEAPAEAETQDLEMPAWRPGRYQIQNYAKHVRGLRARDGQGADLPCRKVAKDRWRLDLSGHAGGEVTVGYEYYAGVMNAGSTYLDDAQLQLNFIACALRLVGREDEPIRVRLHAPSDWKTAAPLPQEKGAFLAVKGFQELVDSPIMASASLQSQSYEHGGTTFRVWFVGEARPEWHKLLADFHAFTKAQIALFGEFPEKEYHFFLQILPYRHYHGVEHERSTLIVLGPDADFGSRGFYRNLLGISSHELFHAWNVCKIRPAEMRPYDFSQETYTEAGLVLEGITTYYGDLMLFRSGVFDEAAYREELDMLFRRHFDNGGRHHASLAESSFDLWLDGYDSPTPDRKVSIYVKGGIVALILHLELLRLSEGKRSLDDVMRLMWQRFGKPEKGYAVEDYISAVEEVAGQPMGEYFSACLYGTEPLEKRLEEALAVAGMGLRKEDSPLSAESRFGMQVRSQGGYAVVVRVAEGSPADEALAVGDAIVSIDGQEISGTADAAFQSRETVALKALRQGRTLSATLRAGEERFFPRYSVVFPEAPNALFEAWRDGTAALTRSASA